MMNRRDILKIVALVSMLIDHSYVFFGNQVWIRSIGRLAFPIYCYLIYDGWVRTSDCERYADRLGLCAILSQYQFTELFRVVGYNVCVTLLFGLIGLSSPVAGIILAVLAEKFNADYGAVGVLSIIAMRVHYVIGVVLIAMFNGKTVMAYFWSTLLVIPLIWWERGDKSELKSNKIVRRIWYFAYPGHILIYLLVKEFLL